MLLGNCISWTRFAKVCKCPFVLTTPLSITQYNSTAQQMTDYKRAIKLKDDLSELYNPRDGRIHVVLQHWFRWSSWAFLCRSAGSLRARCSCVTAVHGADPRTLWHAGAVPRHSPSCSDGILLTRCVVPNIHVILETLAVNSAVYRAISWHHAAVFTYLFIFPRVFSLCWYKKLVAADYNLLCPLGQETLIDAHWCEQNRVNCGDVLFSR